MTTSATWTLAAGATVEIESGGTLTATFQIASLGTFQVDNGGSYVHNWIGSGTGGTTTDFPGTTRTLGASSTVEFQNWGNGGISPTALPSGISWGNIRVNIPSLKGSWNWAGTVTTINGDLTVLATGGATTELLLSDTASPTIAIAGNLNVSGGVLCGNNNNGAEVVNLAGNLNVAGGQCLLKDSWGTKGGSVTWNISGNISVSAGATFGRGTPTTGACAISLAKGSGTQTYNMAGTLTDGSLGIGWTVAAGSTLDLGTSVVSGTASTFTTQTGSGLITAHASGLDGNITVGGTKTWSATGNYSYNGTVPQVTGALLPASVNNLTIANTVGAVQLSGNATVNGTLTVSSGASLDFNSKTVTAAHPPVLQGALTMEVNKTGPNTFTGSKLTQTAGTLTYGGTLTVSASGNTLALGDSIPLFSASSTSYGGGFTSVTGPTVPNGLPKNVTQLTGGTGGNILISCDGSLSASAGASQTVCAGGSGAAIGGSPTASGGSGSYTYSWSPSTGLSSSTVANPTALPATTTTYTVTVTDSQGCTATSSSVTVTVNAVSAGGSASSSAICSGSTAQVTLSGQTGTIQKWQSSPDHSVWTDIASTANPYTTPALTATTYYRAMVQSGVCSSANSGYGTITVNALPTGGVDSMSTSKNTAATISSAKLKANDSGNGLHITAVTAGTGPHPGSVSISGTDGTVTYTPEADYSGSDSFTYTLSNDQSCTVEVTVNVTVGSGSGGSRTWCMGRRSKGVILWCGLRAFQG